MIQTPQITAKLGPNVEHTFLVTCLFIQESAPKTQKRERAVCVFEKALTPATMLGHSCETFKFRF